jgi:hypothetical protein
LALGAIALLVLNAGAQRAMAQFTLSSQDRELSAYASFGDNDGVTTAGVYNQMVSDFADPSDMTGASVNTSAMASQNTDIEVTGFSGTGSATSNAELTGVIMDSTASNADCSFSETFTVPVATVIQLTGELDSSGNGTSGVSFDAFSASGDGSTPTAPFSFSETLEPGTSYTLELEGGSISSAEIDGDSDEGPENAGDGGTGSFNFTFVATSVPEPTTATLLLMAAPAMLARRRRSGCCI